ncbi:MAG TPA: hypothetical protein PLC53_00275 [Bacilli bacterium]|nr:hypothetical protein [Bacilli bacterium]
MAIIDGRIRRLSTKLSKLIREVNGIMEKSIATSNNSAVYIQNLTSEEARELANRTFSLVDSLNEKLEREGQLYDELYILKSRKEYRKNKAKEIRTAKIVILTIALGVVLYMTLYGLPHFLNVREYGNNSTSSIPTEEELGQYFVEQTMNPDSKTAEVIQNLQSKVIPEMIEKNIGGKYI